MQVMCAGWCQCPGLFHQFCLAPPKLGSAIWGECCSSKPPISRIAPLLFIRLSLLMFASASPVTKLVLFLARLHICHHIPELSVQVLTYLPFIAVVGFVVLQVRL